MLNRRLLLQSMAAAAAPTSLVDVRAQDEFPRSKPIRWIVGYPAGGASDLIARTVAAAMSTQIGQQVVVDNRPGSSGMIAAEAAARAPGDGYTVVTVDNGMLIYNKELYRKIPYEPVKDFASVGLIARLEFLLLANNDAPLQSATDFVDAVRKSPGKYSYGSPGIGSPHNLAMEMLKDRNKLFAVPIHYRGGAPMISDLFGGHIQYMVLDLASALPSLKTKKMRPLAVFSRKRLAAFPDVPTVFELGLADVDAVAWQGLAVPASTPLPVRQRLSAELVKAMGSPEMRAKFADLGLEAMPGGSAEMKSLWDSDQKYWSQLIRARKISAE